VYTLLCFESVWIRGSCRGISFSFIFRLIQPSPQWASGSKPQSLFITYLDIYNYFAWGDLIKGVGKEKNGDKQMKQLQRSKGKET
ncbi:MAG: hypothetical protein ACK559_23210, partial [bacterium]